MKFFLHLCPSLSASFPGIVRCCQDALLIAAAATAPPLLSVSRTISRSRCPHFGCTLPRSAVPRASRAALQGPAGAAPT